MSGTTLVCRVGGTRAFPCSNVAEADLTLPPSQDEGFPVVKRPRLWTSASVKISPYPYYSDERRIADPDEYTSDARSNAKEDVADEQSIVDPEAPNVAPTHALAMAASLPKDEPSRVRVRKSTPDEDAELTKAALVHGRPGKWTLVEDALLTEAVQKDGTKWVPVAALVPGRTNAQCRTRWV